MSKKFLKATTGITKSSQKRCHLDETELYNLYYKLCHFKICYKSRHARKKCMLIKINTKNGKQSSRSIGLGFIFSKYYK